jgi:hypothetical protein
VKECCLTAPGNDVLPDEAAILNWNSRESVMWKKFVRLMRKRYSEYEYAAVIEVQQRRAVHVHFLVIGPTEKIDMEYMRSCAVRAGYGPRIQLQSAERRRRAGVYGAVRYLTKYITKALTQWEDRGRHPMRYSRTWTRIAMIVKRKTASAFRLASREVRDWWRYEGGRDRWLRAQELLEDNAYG